MIVGGQPLFYWLCYRTSQSTCRRAQGDHRDRAQMARIFHAMVSTGKPYGVTAYEEAYRERATRQLKRRAQNFGFELVALAT